MEHSMETEYNLIQSSNVTLHQNIEMKLCKLRMGGVEWSPKLQKYHDTIEIWSIMKKWRLKRKLSTKWIQWWMQKIDRMDALNV
jgi:hypothetical protein